MPNACPCWGLSLLLPRHLREFPNTRIAEALRRISFGGRKSCDYFVGEIITCGTPAGVHEIATLRPASLPAERMTALNFARSVFAFGLSGFTEKEVKRSTLPGFKPAMALTSACGALDFRPRFANSASFSGISSNSKLSEVISIPLWKKRIFDLCLSQFVNDFGRFTPYPSPTSMRNTLAKGAGVNSLLITIPNAKPNAKTKAKAKARKAL